MIAAHGECFAVEHNHRAIGQRIDGAPVHAFDFADEAFGVKDFIHRRRGCAFWLAGKQQGELLGVPPPAFEAGPVTGGERGYLIEEEQFSVEVAPNIAMASMKIEDAANPLPRRPAAAGQLFLVGVKPRAAVAHKRPARGRGEQAAKRIDAILQGHYWRQKIRWPGHILTQPPYPIQEDPVTRKDGRVKPKAGGGALIEIKKTACE